MRASRLFLSACLWLAASSAGLAAQKPEKDDEEIKKAGPVDPYTGGDAALMAAAGVVGYGPFPWADSFGTADIDKVLGEHRVLWMETKHFRIGSGLKSVPRPWRELVVVVLFGLAALLPRADCIQALRTSGRR